MRFNLLMIIAVLSVQTVSTPRVVASNFQEVYTAAKNILSGKKFKNEEGTILSFGEVQLIAGSAAAFLPVTIESVDGNKLSHLEFIDRDGVQIRMSKIVQAQVENTFAITVSAPYNVLSIRPLDTDNVEFLSRDCVYKKNEDIHVCYIKTKVGGEVYSSVYTEF